MSTHACRHTPLQVLSHPTPMPILVVDGSGEEESITIAKGEKGKIDYIEVYPLESSLGIFYEGLSKYIGLGRFREGKTMGLSSYGLLLLQIRNYNMLQPHGLDDGGIYEARDPFSGKIYVLEIRGP